MEYGSIYILTFPNGKNYIGQTNNFAKRMTSYPSCIKKGKTLIAKAIKHYGWENIIKKELLRISLADLDYYEIELIKRYNSTDKAKGYNTETGGKLYKKATPGLKLKLSQAHIGQTHSVETRLKISEALRKRIRKPESHRKIAETLKGHTLSSESIQKMKETKHKGFLEGRYKKTTIPIVALDKYTLEPRMYFESATEAGNLLNISNKNITSSLTGRSRVSAGFCWKYANEDKPRYVRKARKLREVA